MKAKAIKDLLSDYFKGSNFKEINEVINLNKTWKKIVGKTISKNTEIVDIKNVNTELLAPGIHAGRLTLYTEESIEKLEKDKLFTK